MTKLRKQGIFLLASSFCCLPANATVGMADEKPAALKPVALKPAAEKPSAEKPKAENPNTSQTEFVSLFDGKTLDGWEGDREWFRIEDGAIVAGSLKKPIPHNYFLCTKRSYGDFEMKIEVKLRGVGDNAGVQFRTKRLPDTTEVSGYQCDVGRAWDRNVWGWLYDESRRNKVLAEGKDEVVDGAFKKDDWNELKIKAVGNKIELFLNGTPTVTFIEEDENIDRQGIIGLQIHSGPPSEALYRNISIRELDAQ